MASNSNNGRVTAPVLKLNTNACSGCGVTFKDRRVLNCSSCKLKYDLLCANIDKQSFIDMNAEAKSSWECPECRCKKPKVVNSDSTPVRSLPREDPNATHRVKEKMLTAQPKNPNSLDTNNSDIAALTAEIRLLREEMADFKQQCITLTESLGNCNNRLDECDKKILKRDQEIIELKAAMIQLQQENSNRAQNQLSNEVEISGIGEEPKENLHHIVLLTAKKIGVELSDKDIDWAIRVGPPQSTAKIDVLTETETEAVMEAGAKLADAKLKEKAPRPIVVRFTRRKLRDDFLEGAKGRRGLKSDDIVHGTSRNVFINERLTKENRYLFRNARIAAAEKGYKYCWVRNGRIFIRRADKRPVISIRSHEDLEQLTGNARLPAAVQKPEIDQKQSTSDESQLLS